VLLELRHRRAVDGPVAGIVHAGRDLVDQERLIAALAHHEHLDGQDADIVEGLGDAGGDLPCFGCKRRRDFRRHARDFQNVVAVLILRHLETFDLAVAAARGDDGDLALEIDEAFDDAGSVVQRPPRGRWIAAFRDLGLAFSVIAELAGLEHGRQTGDRDTVGQLGCAVHRRIRRGRDLQRADEILFDQPVLRRLQHLRVRQHRPALGEKRCGLSWHVLEFVGDDIDRPGKAPERGLVVIFGAGAGVHHVECAGILFGRIDVAAQSQRRRREREHAGELAAAEDADGRAGFQQITPRSSPRKRGSRTT